MFPQFTVPPDDETHSTSCKVFPKFPAKVSLFGPIQMTTSPYVNTTVPLTAECFQ